MDKTPAEELKFIRDAFSEFQARVAVVHFNDRQTFADSRRMVLETRQMIIEIDRSFKP